MRDDDFLAAGTLPTMNLSDAHRTVLAAIGDGGATREVLGDYAGSQELEELVRTEYVREEVIELNETGPEPEPEPRRVWYLTQRGRDALRGSSIDEG